MSRTAADVLSVARSQLGYQEASGNRTKYGAWYGLDGNAWCAMFVSWCAYKAGCAEIIPKHAYTPSGAQWFRDKGQWHSSPKVGDVVYYEWPGMGRISHVGFVESVRSDGSIVALEGNTNPGGASRTGGGVYRVVRRSYIAGYGRPKYAAPAFETKPKDGKLTVDGDFGSQTIQALQRVIKVTADGEFGPKSKVALQKHLGVTADGAIGSGTVRALQRHVGLTGEDVDGVWGSQTTKALQKALNAGKC